MPAILGLLGVSNGRNDSRRGQGADSRDLPETLAQLAARHHLLDPRVGLFDTRLERVQVLQGVDQHSATVDGDFLNRQIEGDWPYLWIDATHVKTREADRIVSVALIVAVGVSTEGQREVLGLKVGASEAEPFWNEFLRSLNRRGLRGVKLVNSNSHEGIKAAAAKGLKAIWQRCRVHFMRNALAHAGKTQRRMVRAAIGSMFVQDSAEAARAQWRTVADQLRGAFPKLGPLMDDAENDVLAFMTYHRAHWSQIHSTNPLERLNADIKQRTNVVGIFPNDAGIVHLAGAMMLEQNDEKSLNRRDTQLENLQTVSDTFLTRLSAVARRVPRISSLSELWTCTMRSAWTS